MFHTQWMIYPALICGWPLVMLPSLSLTQHQSHLPLCSCLRIWHWLLPSLETSFSRFPYGSPLSSFKHLVKWHLPSEVFLTMVKRILYCKFICPSLCFSFLALFVDLVLQFSRSVVSDSLRPHELQHARSPCPSPTPGVHSDSRSSSQWCHPAISSSVVPFSSRPQSLPASGHFPVKTFTTT